MGRAMRISVSDHGEQQLRGRLGRGANALQVARRCWDRQQSPPDEWEVPVKPGYRYLRYGDCVFVFGHGFGNGRALVTVVGPFAPGMKWKPKIDL